MYNLIRTIHLYVGLTLLTFVLMYFVTGYVIIHRDLVPEGDTTRTVRIEAIDYVGAPSPDGVAVYLQEQFGFVGKRNPPRRLADGRWRFDYFRPGHRYTAFINTDGDSVRIEYQAQTGRPVLAGFHVLHGYGGGLLYDVWSVFYDLASLALIVFPITGIYMWYTLTRRHLLGWICLALSFGYAAATILYLSLRP